MNDFQLRIREDELGFDVGFIKRKPAYSVRRDSARIGLHETPCGHLCLLLRIAQLFEDLLGVR